MGSSLNSRLKYENEKLYTGLKESQTANAAFHDNYNSLRDENVSLKKSLERLLRVNNEETLEKEDLAHRNKSLSAQNVDMSNDLQDALERCASAEEQNAQLQGVLTDARDHMATQSEQIENMQLLRIDMEVNTVIL